MARPTVWSRAVTAQEVAALDDDPPRLLLVGPRGSGKTEILEAVVDGLDRPATWVRGRPFETALEFGAFEDLLATTPEDVSSARQAVIEALGDDPLLVVDAAQWLDRSSLEVVLALGERRGELGLGLLVAQRPASGSDSGRALARLADVFGSAATMSLPPLTDDEVAERVAIVLDAPADEGLVDVVAEESAGLLHLVDAVAAGWTEDGLVHRGALVPESDRERDAATSAAFVGRVRPALEGLGPDEVGVLRVLAFGPLADDQLVVSVAGIEPDELSGTQASLRAEGLLTDRDQVPPALVDALTELTPAPERRAVHSALAAALTARGSPPAVLADQLAAAGAAGPEAGAVFLATAEQLVDEAPDLATEWYDRAGVAGTDAARLAAGRAQVALVAGDVVAARREAESGSGDRTERVLAAVDLAQGRPERAASHLARGSDPDWAALAEALRGATADPVGDGPEAGVLRGLAAARAGDVDRAMRSFVEAADVVESRGGAGVLPDSPHAVGAVVALVAGDAAIAGHLAERAVSAGVGGAFLRQRHLLLRAWVALREGRLAAVETALGDARPVVPRDRLVAVALGASLARRTGDLVGLEQAWADAEPLLVGVEPDLLLLEPVGELAAASSRLDTWARASRFLEPLRGLVSGWALWDLRLAWLDLQSALADDDEDAVVTAASAVEACSPATPQTAALPVAAAAWSRVVAGGFEVDEVERAAEGLHQVGLTWEASQLTGQAAIRSDDGAVTRALLGRARELKTPTASAARDDDETGLSDREREVARLVVDGLTYKEVGAQLFISPKTVEHHVARIRQKVGASTRAEMLASLRTYLG